jgi:MFS transporter, DHA1 family, multidrug resistance protein
LNEKLTLPFRIFLQGMNYIIDVYLMNSNSAIAANGLLRSACGAGFPLFATAMYENLGVNWATSVLGFIAVALMPVPILFYIFGARIRRLSRFSPNLVPPTD